MAKNHMEELNTIPGTITRPTVFYDGGCQLCRREIAHYQRLDRCANLHWVDITDDAEVMARHGLQYQTAMARFHVLDRQGRWHTGAWGFAEMWLHLPGYRLLARILRNAGALPLLDRAYTLFAGWRARRRCDNRCTASPGEGT